MPKTQKLPTSKKELIQLFVNRINKGVQYLDKTLGRNKWQKNVDLELLDLSEQDMCICGQAFMEQAAKWNRNKDDDDTELDNGFQYVEQKLSTEKLAEYGFYIEAEIESAFEHSYDLLTNLWIAKLSKLLK